MARPRSSTDIIDWARMFVIGGAPEGRRLGIVTASGGAGILMSDAADIAGLQVPELRRSDQERLVAVLPAFGSATNAVDCTGHIVNDVTVFTGVLRTVAESDRVDVVAVGACPTPWRTGGLRRWPTSAA